MKKRKLITSKVIYELLMNDLTAFIQACPDGLDPNDKHAVARALAGGELGCFWRWAVDQELLHEDMSGVVMKSAKLDNANLRRINLSGANLEDANLRSANLNYGRLSRVNFRYARMRYAQLMSADLTHADLSWANLASANLSRANLCNANLKHCNLLVHHPSLSVDNLQTDLRGAKYNDATIFPEGFDPLAHGMIHSRGAAPSRLEPLSVASEINRLREAVKAGYRLPSCVQHAVKAEPRAFGDNPRALHLYMPSHLLADAGIQLDYVHVAVDLADGEVLSMTWFNGGEDGNAIDPQHIPVHAQAYMHTLIIAAAIIHGADPRDWNTEQTILEPPA